MDTLSPANRSLLMSKVHGKNTKPEMAVRKCLHALGFRFRLHRKNLPGKPDIVLPKYKTVIFVHGCFWHRHPWCRKTTIPSTNTEFWEEKFLKNRERDAMNRKDLEALGWKVIAIWECETNNRSFARNLLENLSNSDPHCEKDQSGENSDCRS